MSLEIQCRARLLKTTDGAQAVKLLDAWEKRITNTEDALTAAQAEVAELRVSVRTLENERADHYEHSRTTTEAALKTCIRARERMSAMLAVTREKLESISELPCQSVDRRGASCECCRAVSDVLARRAEPQPAPVMPDPAGHIYTDTRPRKP